MSVELDTPLTKDVNLIHAVFPGGNIVYSVVIDGVIWPVYSDMIHNIVQIHESKILSVFALLTLTLEALLLFKLLPKTLLADASYRASHRPHLEQF